MAMTVGRLAPTFCGEVSGVDLTRLETDDIGALKSAWLDQKVLVFHDQNLDEDALVDFAGRVGDIEIHLRQTRTGGRREVMLVSNKQENGQPIGRLGNQELNWHMDQIFMAEPTAGTLLYAVEVTPEGGDTWFCDLAAAYEALPSPLRDRVDGRRAVHSAATADRRVGIHLTEEQRARAPEAVHPLVRTHPLGGGKALYFSLNHTARIDGWSEDDSLTLLDDLHRHATDPRFVYVHHWRVGDLVLWDNAATMHRRDPFPDHHARLMRRVGVNFPAGLRVPFFSVIAMPLHRLTVVDPGHFHAALAQKEMYDNVAETVQVYAPVGPDLVDYLARIARFNTRADNPTTWRLEMHAGPDPALRMARDKPGDVAIVANRNSEKLGAIAAAVDAGMHVLADKPIIIRRRDLPALADVLGHAASRGLVVRDMMGGRAEITRALTRLLHADPEIFGEQLPGSAAEPGVAMTSLHHLMKIVSGAPNLRPAWYFDISQQGDALADIGTHLVDRVHTTLFSDEALDHRRDIAIGAVERWPTALDLGQFRHVTGEAAWPGYLAAKIGGGRLAYDCNVRLGYAVRGVHVELDMVWDWQEPPGGSDIHTEIWRGSRARIELRHGPGENWRAQLYVVPESDIAAPLTRRIAALAEHYPGLGLERVDGAWRIVVPDALRIGHDAHFRELTKGFLAAVDDPGAVNPSEHPNLIAKYFVCTAAEALGG